MKYHCKDHIVVSCCTAIYYWIYSSKFDYILQQQTHIHSIYKLDLFQHVKMNASRYLYTLNLQPVKWLSFWSKTGNCHSSGCWLNQNLIPFDCFVDWQNTRNMDRKVWQNKYLWSVCHQSSLCSRLFGKDRFCWSKTWVSFGYSNFHNKMFKSF